MKLICVFVCVFSLERILPGVVLQLFRRVMWRTIAGLILVVILALPASIVSAVPKTNRVIFHVALTPEDDVGSSNVTVELHPEWAPNGVARFTVRANRLISLSLSRHLLLHLVLFPLLLLGSPSPLISRSL